MAVQNNATVQMVRDLISGDINLPLYAAKGGKLVPVYYDGTSWTAISGYTAQVNVGDVALVLMLASSANWGTNQLGDLRVITAVSTSLTLSETLLGNIFGAGGRYRVGDIVISANETSPAEAYGGSWEKVTDRFPIGAGGSYPLGSTGGEANVTLTMEQAPRHQHAIIEATTGALVGLYIGDRVDGIEILPSSWATTDNVGRQMWTTNEGGGQAHNNMPPYIAVNIWRRVA